MDRFDFNSYKEKYDKITLSDIQKEKLKQAMLSNKNTAKSKKLNFRKILATASAIVLISALSFSTDFIRQITEKPQEVLHNAKIAVCLENNLSNEKSDNYILSENDTVITNKSDDISLTYQNISVSELDIIVKDKNIRSVGIKSEKGNTIAYTYYKTDNDLVTDMTKSDISVSYKALKKLSWIASDENLNKAYKDKDIKKHLSDTVDITVTYNDNTKSNKQLTVNFDNKGNYIVACKNK